MVSKRADRGTEEGEEQRIERAIELFANWISDPGNDPPKEFDALLSKHPDLVDLLQTMHSGLNTFRRGVEAHALKPDASNVHRASIRTTRKRPFFRLQLGIAVVVFLSLTLWWMYFGTSGKNSRESLLIARQACAILEFFDLSEGVPQSLTAELDNSDRDLLLSNLSNTVNEAEKLAEVASASLWTRLISRKEIRQTLETLQRIRDELGEEAWQKPSRVGTSKSLAFACALTLNREERSLVRAFGLLSQIPTISSIVATSFVETHLMLLDVIDLDADGTNYDGALVYGMKSDPQTGELGAAEFFGKSPLLNKSIRPGDWRILVVDPVLERHSELRLIALPGEDIVHQVAFLRTKEDVVTDRMAWIPVSEYSYGARAEEKINLHLAERRISAGDFWIDRFEVTNEEYASFLLDIFAHQAQWFPEGLPINPPYLFEDDGSYPEDKATLPVVGVQWKEAVLYANWAGKRLPTDREWERVAQGASNRRYPWGDDFSEGRVQLDASFFWEAETSGNAGKMVLRSIDVKDGATRWEPVDLFPEGATPDEGGGRVFRLADNATEWVEDLLLLPSESNPQKSLYYPDDVLHRVVRGASWYSASERSCRSDMRRGLRPDVRLDNPEIGIRCARSPYPENLPVE